MNSTDSASKSPRRDSVQVVERAFAVLAVLEEGGQASALEVARATGLNRTVVHRLLSTLVESNVVVLRNHRYGLGPQLLALGNAYLDHLAIRRLALPYAIQLRDEVAKDNPWSVGLAVPVGSQVVVVDRLWGNSTPLTSILNIGSRLCIQTSAGGRAILAAADYDMAIRLVGADVYEGMRDDLDKVRRSDGVAADFGAIAPGVGAIAAPLMEGSRPVAALLVAGVDIQEAVGAESPTSQAVSRTAREISRLMAGPQRIG